MDSLFQSPGRTNNELLFVANNHCSFLIIVFFFFLLKKEKVHSLQFLCTTEGKMERAKMDEFIFRSSNQICLV